MRARMMPAGLKMCNWVKFNRFSKFLFYDKIHRYTKIVSSLQTCHEQATRRIIREAKLRPRMISRRIRMSKIPHPFERNRKRVDVIARFLDKEKAKFLLNNRGLRCFSNLVIGRLFRVQILHRYEGLKENRDRPIIKWKKQFLTEVETLRLS